LIGPVATQGKEVSAMKRFAALAVLALTAPLARAADVDPHLPEDTKSYFSVNVKQIFGSAIFKRYALGPAKDLLREVGGEDVFK
jgi:hypothetical protein